jgi:hypothetical protein
VNSRLACSRPAAFEQRVPPSDTTLSR